MVTGDSVVDHMQDCFELLRVDFFVLTRDVQSGYSEALQIGFLKVLPSHQGLVNNAYCYIEGLRPHLELVVKFSEPINKVLPILVGYLALEFFV